MTPIDFEIVNQEGEGLVLDTKLQTFVICDSLGNYSMPSQKLSNNYSFHFQRVSRILTKEGRSYDSENNDNFMKVRR